MLRAMHRFQSPPPGRTLAAVGLVLAACASPASSEDRTLPASAAPAACAAAPSRHLETWAAFRALFLKPDGRIVDDYTGVSHTESQGAGMILAALAGDREAFSSIWSWTDGALRRPDGLFSWRYDPAAETPVADPNNATDGDLMIGWGLALAAERWGEAGHRRAAVAIARAVDRQVVKRLHGRLVLLPGRDGFEKPEGVTLNTSYYVLPAMRALAEIAGVPRLAAAADAGLALIDEARFGEFGLPADWIFLDPTGAVILSQDHPPRFGYEAIRVPLYLAWDGALSPARARPFCTAWAGRGAGEPPPSWIDLTTSERAPYRASEAFAAIARLAEKACGASNPDPMPAIGPGTGYYAASLVAFAAHAEARSCLR